MGHPQVQAARQIMSNNRIASNQMVTLQAIDNSTNPGKQVVRQFLTYQGCESWLGTFETNNLEILRIY
jgi:hypothetical protein